MIGRTMLVAASMGGILLTGCSKKEPEQPAPQPAAAEETVRPAQPAVETNDRTAEEAEARARAEAERLRAVLTQVIHFDYDESAIRPSDQETLAAKAAILREYPDVRLRIAGHADERGSIEYNLALGMRRAEAAKQFLVNYGLDASRFETVSFGEERPVAPGQDESAYAQNRRDEFQIIAGDDALVPRP